MRGSWFVLGALVALILIVGCGGGGSKGANSADSAEAEQDPMTELQGIPKELEHEALNLTKPIDELQSVLDDLASIPSRYGITAADLSASVQAVLENGTIELKASTNLSASAKAEIEAALGKLKVVVSAIKATPSKVAALIGKLPGFAARVPMLVTKVTVSANLTASNPFGAESAKAEAKANLTKVKQAQAEVMKVIQETQAKVVGIPAMATAALHKLTASFSDGGTGIASNAPQDATTAVQPEDDVANVADTAADESTQLDPASSESTTSSLSTTPSANARTTLSTSTTPSSSTSTTSSTSASNDPNPSEISSASSSLLIADLKKRYPKASPERLEELAKRYQATMGQYQWTSVPLLSENVDPKQAATKRTLNPTTSDTVTACVMGPPLVVDGAASLATCVGGEIGPFTVTDVVVGGGCKADLFIESANGSTVRWAVVIPPASSLAMHGVNLVVGSRDQLLVGAMTKAKKWNAKQLMKADPRCAVTWTTAPEGTD